MELLIVEGTSTETETEQERLHRIRYEERKAKALAKKAEWEGLTPQERIDLLINGLIDYKTNNQSNMPDKWKIPYQYPVCLNGIYYGYALKFEVNYSHSDDVRLSFVVVPSPFQYREWEQNESQRELTREQLDEWRILIAPLLTKLKDCFTKEEMSGFGIFDKIDFEPNTSMKDFNFHALKAWLDVDPVKGVEIYQKAKEIFGDVLEGNIKG